MKTILTKRLIKETYAVKQLSKYVIYFDCIDKILIALSATSGGVSIISLRSVVRAPIGIATGIIKKFLTITRNKKKKHDKILMLAKSRLNSIETLVSQEMIDMEKNYEKFVPILKKEDKYEKMKENVKNISEKQQCMRLSSVNSKKNNEFVNNLCLILLEAHI